MSQRKLLLLLGTGVLLEHLASLSAFFQTNACVCVHTSRFVQGFFDLAIVGQSSRDGLALGSVHDAARIRSLKSHIRLGCLGIPPHPMHPPRPFVFQIPWSTRDLSYVAVHKLARRLMLE